MENLNKLEIYSIGAAVSVGLAILLTYGQIYLTARIMGCTFRDTAIKLGTIGVVSVSAVSLCVSIFFVIKEGSYFY